MGFFGSLFGRKQPPAPTSTTRVTVSPNSFRVESHYEFAEDSANECAWGSVSGAFRSHYTMKGINVCTVEPPYLEWVPADAEGTDELLAELERRKLLGPEEQIMMAWEATLSELLAGVEARLFDAANRDEAGRLLAPFRSSPRVALAVVELSGGSLEELRKVAGWAREDPRDAIHAAWQAKKS